MISIQFVDNDFRMLHSRTTDAPVHPVRTRSVTNGVNAHLRGISRYGDTFMEADHAQGYTGVWNGRYHGADNKDECAAGSVASEEGARTQ